jgi:hypothetical protein
MFRKAAFSAFAVLVAVGCGGSGGGATQTGTPDFLLLNKDGTFLRSDPTGTNLQPVNQYRGMHGAIRPDGEVVAYNALIDGQTQIRIVHISGTTDHKLIDVNGESSLAFLAGGNEVAFIDGDEEKTWLKAVNAVNGETRVLAELPRLMFSTSGLSINPEGTKAAITVDAGDSVSHVMLFSLNGSMHADLGRGAHARFSQDGRRLAYITEGNNLAIRDLTTQTTTITDLPQPIHRVAFSSRTDSVYISVRTDDSPESQSHKVARLTIGSETPEYLPRQQNTDYTLVASVGPG